VLPISGVSSPGNALPTTKVACQPRWSEILTASRAAWYTLVQTVANSGAHTQNEPFVSEYRILIQMSYRFSADFIISPTAKSASPVSTKRCDPSGAQI